MTDMYVKPKVRNRQIAIDSEVIYMQLMGINAKKKLPLHYVMSFENWNVPMNLFHYDSSLNLSKNKSDFAPKLEALLPKCAILHSVPNVDTVILL